MRRVQDGGQNGSKGHTEQSILSRRLDYFPGFGLVLATLQFEIKKKKKSKGSNSTFLNFQIDFVYIVCRGALKYYREYRVPIIYLHPHT